MKKYYWKVVCVTDNNHYISAVITHGKHCLTYKLNKITRPKTLPGIYCFKTRELARDWKRNTNYNTKILKVIPMGKPLENIPFYHWRDVLFEDFLSPSSVHVPTGTICFNAVKPVAICR